MSTDDFDELAGRLEAMSRAVLTLAWAVECETDMDGLTLTRQWRESVPDNPATPALRTARHTLHQMAALLDKQREGHRARVLRWRLAAPERCRPAAA